MSNSVHILEDLANRDSDPLGSFIIKIADRLISLEERVLELEAKAVWLAEEGYDDAN